ncbi:MAG: hypothetical protein K5669_11030 [Lachnospiraceae bacterium]|nr:hypothetical protein [Lachnospiraceae bacterium]
MKVTFSHEVFNPDSEERIPLIIKDVNVGDYSFGTYSKWMINRIDKNMRDIPDIPTYLCWLIRDNFGIEMRDTNKILEAKDLCGV